MKKICLVMPVLVGVLMLFSAIKVGAACDLTLPAGWCLEKNGYKIEVADKNGTPIGSDGTFPVIEGGNSIYTYKITKTTAKRLFNGVDILIPVCPQSLGKPSSYFCGTPKNHLCSGNLYTGGSGDPWTRFGFGLITNDTWNWSMLTDQNTMTVSLTLNGIHYALPNGVLVKVGLIFSDFVYGQIATPSCGLTTAPTFTIDVPKPGTIEQNTLGIDLCWEPAGESGCPASIYSCSDDTVLSACNCPSGSPPREYWAKKTFLDQGITGAHPLLQVWTRPDSRCPTTHSVNQGSCQITTYLPDGTLFTYTYPSITGKVTSGGSPVSGAWMKVCKGTTTNCTNQTTSSKTGSDGSYNACAPSNPFTGRITPMQGSAAIGDFVPVNKAQVGVSGKDPYPASW